MTKTTITINGRMYDALTGMPVVAASAPNQSNHTAHKAFTDVAPAASAPQPAPRTTHEVHAAAQAVHQITQKSHTLHRGALQKPQAARATVGRSQQITKFAAAPQAQATPQAPQQPEQTIPNATIHPMVAKALHSHAAPAAAHQQPQLSGSDLKEQLIKERLAEIDNAPAKKEKKASWLSRQPRLVTILSSTLSLLILGGYLTYITLPSISLKVAASRAGVDASMPEYKPDGYSLDGPITYSPGEVVISYKSNTNESGYKITQKATNWDSQAVLDNYVGKLADNYLTFQEKGITVYTFGNKAVWVNGGLLYNIDGDAALSSDQILRIASSI